MDLPGGLVDPGDSGPGVVELEQVAGAVVQGHGQVASLGLLPEEVAPAGVAVALRHPLEVFFPEQITGDAGLGQLFNPAVEVKREVGLAVESRRRRSREENLPQLVVGQLEHDIEVRITRCRQAQITTDGITRAARRSGRGFDGTRPLISLEDV